MLLIGRLRRQDSSAKWGELVAGEEGQMMEKGVSKRSSRNGGGDLDAERRSLLE